MARHFTRKAGPLGRQETLARRQTRQVKRTERALDLDALARDLGAVAR